MSRINLGHTPHRDEEGEDVKMAGIAGTCRNVVYEHEKSQSQFFPLRLPWLIPYSRKLSAGIDSRQKLRVRLLF